VRIKGYRYVFVPDYTDRDGYPGYPTLPKGLSKDQLASFYSFEAGPDDEELSVVESATASPGEKRSTKKKTPAKPKSDG
jgi:hypothetical protein